MARIMICDFCEVKILNPAGFNMCTWGCGRDMCKEHIYIDDMSRSACEFCVKLKGLKVRKATDPVGTEHY